MQRIVKSRPENGDLITHVKNRLKKSGLSPARYYWDLRDNWRFLSQSIAEAIPMDLKPDERVFVIASRYFQLADVAVGAQKYLAAQERIIPR